MVLYWDDEDSELGAGTRGPYDLLWIMADVSHPCSAGPYEEIPGPPKVPQIMVQHPKRKSIDSIGSIVSGILEVQVSRLWSHCSSLG